MTVIQVLALAGLAAMLGLVRRGRSLMLMGFSLLVVFWLQPVNRDVAHLAFWLPMLTIFISVLSWVITSPPELRTFQGNWSAFVAIIGVVALVVLSMKFPWMQLPSPGSYKLVAMALTSFLLMVVGLSCIKRGGQFLLVAAALGLLHIFVFLKSPWMFDQAVSLVSNLIGHSVESPIRFNFTWLGYSYIAFRLLHTIRDRQTGVLPAVGLAEYVDYVIFFPSFTAGPIDRLEHFVQELRFPLPLNNSDWFFVGQRLVLGLFKKFVVADGLAMISAKDVLVDQTLGGGWLWLTLCAYSLRLYFDFSGYTDIAIGLGRMMGIRLPENFTSPFLKSNMTQFWNSWHITLTQWFRYYFFYPVTRFLRSSKRSLPSWFIILIGQLGTMLLIGLWHGITWNYALWGLWHGLGLFVQNRWSEFIRMRFPNLALSPAARSLFHVGGILLTFSYFTLGVVFFALSSPRLSLEAIRKIFGVS